VRSLLDLRLSPLALALLAAASTVATALILLSGGHHTPAQNAALAALREPAPKIVASARGLRAAAARVPGHRAAPRRAAPGRAGRRRSGTRRGHRPPPLRAHR
jgi:hypothetical protein